MATGAEPMRIVIVGAGITGLALARSLRRRGFAPLVLERGPAGAHAPRPFMLPYHGFDALEDAGVLAGIRALGWDIAPRADGTPVAIAVDFVAAAGVLGEGVPVAGHREVVALVRQGGRVVGVRAQGPGGAEEHPTDLVVACDGVRSPVRTLAGIAAALTPAEGAHLSFLSPAVVDRAFAMAYQSDGRQVGLLGWPEGSAGWWDIDRVGRQAALAPGLAAFRRSFARLLPAAEPALAGLTTMDQVIYREVTEVRCAGWWVPGVVTIGDAAHFLGPEAGLGAGMGLGDALALAIAIERNPADPDAACADYARWREPATRPYEAVGAAGARMVPPGAGERPDTERWPPVG